MLYGYVDYTCEAIPRPFYVGIGNLSRVKQKKRNRKHSEVVTNLGCKRVVEFECTSSTILEEWEIGTTAAYHTYVHDPLYNGIGCNLVMGGHRNSGRVDNEEVRQKRGRAVSDALKGKSFPKPSLKGRKMPPRSAIWIANLRQANAGKKRKCLPKSDVTKQKMRIVAFGNTNGAGNKGKTRLDKRCRCCHENGHDTRTCVQYGFWQSSCEWFTRVK